MSIPDLKLPDDHQKRMAVARRRAEWELGDGYWADAIIGAYLYPDADTHSLAYEKDES